MKNIQVTAHIDMEVKASTIVGLLICAFEGGSNYWYDDLKLLERSSKAEVPSERFYEDMITHGFSIQDKVTKEAYIIRQDNLVEGIVLMATQHPKHFMDAQNENDDAITGDVYLQLVVHRKVIYG